MLTRILSLVVLVGASLAGYGQGRSLELYQYNYTSVSPAFAGVDGTKFTFIGNALFPFGGAAIGLLGAESSYKNFGLGATWMRQALGPQTFSDYALPLNYQWNINEKSKLVFGARLSYQVSELDFTKYRPLDPNDPLLGTSKLSKSFGNVSLGALYKNDFIYGGFSVDNLLTKEQVQNELTALPKMYHLIVGRDIKGKGKFSSMHSVNISFIEKSWIFDVNTSVIYNDLIIAGFSIAFTDEEKVIPKVNAGVKFGEYGKAVVMLYSKNNETAYKDFSAQLFLMFTLPAL